MPRISSFRRGCAARQFGSRGTSHRAANALVAVMRSRPLVVPGAHRRQHFRESLEAIADDRKELFPRRVSLSGRGRGRNRALPQWRSSSLIWWLMAVGVTYKLSRCHLEAQMTRRGFEGPQLGQGWQLAHRIDVDEFSSSCT